jgi:hypothetical protein
MSIFKFTDSLWSVIGDNLLLFSDITFYKSFISNTLQYNYPKQNIYIYTYIYIYT